MSAALRGEPAVVVDRLSKVYEIGSRSRYEPVTPLLTRLRGLAPLGMLAEDEEDDEGDEPLVDDYGSVARDRTLVWALREVSFEVPTGSTFGILGGPGAGKSTLLQILAGSLPPTDGRATLHGRTNPLADAARLFMRVDHTLSRNVQSVARLGGSRVRLSSQQADEVVRFVVGPGPDPIGSKTIFQHLAVGAVLFLEPDVLLLDDLVLADGEFRERCLARIESRQGAQTVIIASRNVDLLSRLCSDGVLLDNGSIVARGSPKALAAGAPAAEAAPVRRGFSHLAAILTVETESTEGAPRQVFRWDEDVVVRVDLEMLGVGELLRCSLEVLAGPETVLSASQPEPHLCAEPGYVSLRARIQARTLVADAYSVNVHVAMSHGGSDFPIAREAAASFRIHTPPEMEPDDGADFDPPNEEIELTEGPDSPAVQWTVGLAGEPD
jgi:ABC-type polysaccharide/polyol phosphate transport system ATPase subunit